MCKKTLLLTLFSIVLYSASFPSTEKSFLKINNATVNTFMIFTSQEELNSGKYFFTNRPESLKMNIYHLPFLYQFSSTTKLNYFLIGNVGYSEISLNENYQSLNSVKAYTAGAGGGVRYQLYNKLYLSLGTEFIYSQLGIYAKGDRLFGGAFEDLFKKNSTQNLTYKFFGVAEYRPIWREFKPYISLGKKLYETKSRFTLNDLGSFHSVSSVTFFTFGVETPPLYNYTQEDFLTFEVYLHRYLLNGVVKDVIKVDRYNNFGALLYWNRSKAPWWISRYYLESTVTEADGLSGYNIGIGVTFDF